MAGDQLAGMPGHWQHETSGRLEPAVLALLEQRPLTPEQIDILRAYLRQWINAPVWRGSEIDALRSQVDGLTTRRRIEAWVWMAEACGADPI